MNIAFVHGKKLLNNGDLHPEFIERLEMAKQLLGRSTVDKIIVSGGQTRAQFAPEASRGIAYLRSHGLSEDRLIALNSGHSTIDEVLNLKQYVTSHKNIKKMCVVMSSWPMLRTRLIYRFLWNLPGKVKFVPARNRDYLFYVLSEPFALVFTIVYLLVPHKFLDRTIKWFTMEFRNAPLK